MKWRQKIKYQIDQFFTKGTLSLVLMLFFITFLSIVVVGILAFWVSGSTGSVFSVIWASFMKSLDAGNLNGEEGTFSYILLMTIQTIIGIFVTSILISILSNGFQTRLENLRKGTSQIMEKNHTLILGWNDNVPVIVSELVTANLSAKHPVIAILSEEDMCETLTLLKTMVKNFHNSKIIIRTGSIFDKANLNMCAIQDAKSVILSDIDDVKIIKALVAIKQTGFFQETNLGFATAIFQNQQNLKVAMDLCGSKLEAIHLAKDMDRIMAQTCLQPGLSFVYKDLFDFAGDEFYFYQNEKLVGKTIGEAYHLFKSAILVGLLHKGTIQINPANGTIISQDDRLIVIGADDEAIFVDGNPTNRFDSQIISDGHRESKGQRNILSIGYNINTLSVITEMFPFVKKGTDITFLTPVPLKEESIQEMQNDGLIQFHFLVGTTFERQSLDRVDYSRLDTIIVFANDLGDGERSDSETLLTVLNLKQIEKEQGLNLSIIIEIEKNHNESILQYASIDDFIISNVLSTKLLCQISENRHLHGIFEELLDVSGSEIYLKQAEHYVTLHQPVDFYTVGKSAFLKNETAIGYKRKTVALNDGIVLNPDKDKLVTFGEGDRIIVLSED